MLCKRSYRACLQLIDNKHSVVAAISTSLARQNRQEKVLSTPKSTLKANFKACRAFRAYLDESGQHDDVDKLNQALERFWSSARKQKTSETKKVFYKASSLENLRNGLNWYLKAPPFNKSFDIIGLKDKKFNAANVSFKAALSELKDMGNGEVSHHPEIEDADLKKLYSNFNSACSARDPVVLQE